MEMGGDRRSSGVLADQVDFGQYVDEVCFYPDLGEDTDDIDAFDCFAKDAIGDRDAAF